MKIRRLAAAAAIAILAGLGAGPPAWSVPIGGPGRMVMVCHAGHNIMVDRSSRDYQIHLRHRHDRIAGRDGSPQFRSGMCRR